MKPSMCTTTLLVAPRAPRPMGWALAIALSVAGGLGCGDDTEATGSDGAGGAGASGTPSTTTTTGRGGAGGEATSGGGGGMDDTSVAVRFLHLGPPVPGAPTLDVCLEGPGRTFAEGPLLGTGLSPGEASAPVNLPSGPSTTTVRWVEGGRADCGVAVDDEADTDVDLAMGASVGWIARLDEDGSAGATFATRYLPGLTLSNIEPGRFYARFFHAGLDAGVLNLKQNDCAIPFSAFEQASYGAFAFSPNNQAEFFSASVTAGDDNFTTDVVVCAPGNAEILRLESFRFDGGAIQFSALIGDGTGPAPYRMLRCIERGSEPCVLLP